MQILVPKKRRVLLVTIVSPASGSGCDNTGEGRGAICQEVTIVPRMIRSPGISSSRQIVLITSGCRDTERFLVRHKVK